MKNNGELRRDCIFTEVVGFERDKQKATRER